MKQFLLCFFLILFTYAINIKELQNQIDFPSLYQVSPCKKEKYGDVGDTCDPTQNSLRRCKLFLACSNSGGQGFKCVPGMIFFKRFFHQEKKDILEHHVNQIWIVGNHQEKVFDVFMEDV